jgi:cell pole-organizing protein PopZ
MEEILASIRRIIADDQEGGHAGGGASRAAPMPAAQADDDVLDLAELSPPPAPSRPTLVAEKAPEPEPVRPVAPAMPELRAVEPVRQPEPEPEEEPAILSFRPSLSDFAVEDEPAPPPRPAAARPAPQPMPAPEPEATIEPLVSGDAMASVGNAFSMLSHTILTQNARTLEDLVKDMLKPMLKVWLDDNLPPLVERLVRAEIERVARGGR